MMFSRSLLLIAVVIAGCSTPTGPSPIDRVSQLSMDAVQSYSVALGIYLNDHSEDDAIAKGKSAVADLLKDPESAKFRNIRIATYLTGKVICGEVNGKNSYGGYTGYTLFVASMDTGTLYSTDNKYPVIQNAANSGIFAACQR